ncbi:trigger factor, partial [uncultured Dubosiella sp.]
MDKKLKRENKDTVIIEAVAPKDEIEKVMKDAAERQPDADEAKIRETALQFEAMQLIQEAVTEEGLKLAAQPEMKFKDEKDGDVLITLTCTLVPDVDLGQYTGMDVLKEEVSVSDEEVLEFVNNEINSKELWEAVDRPAKEHDQVLIDFVGVKDGVPFDGGSAENFPLVLGSHSFIPGFEEQL